MDPDLIGPNEVAFHLDLTPPQLKILHAALMSFRDTHSPFWSRVLAS